MRLTFTIHASHYDTSYSLPGVVSARAAVAGRRGEFSFSREHGLRARTDFSGTWQRIARVGCRWQRVRRLHDVVWGPDSRACPPRDLPCSFAGDVGRLAL